MMRTKYILLSYINHGSVFSHSQGYNNVELRFYQHGQKLLQFAV